MGRPFLNIRHRIARALIAISHSNIKYRISAPAFFSLTRQQQHSFRRKAAMDWRTKRLNWSKITRTRHAPAFE
jgi:hypothetical protein